MQRTGAEPAQQGPSSGRPRGRPRDRTKDRAIRNAVWTVLATRGYDNLSFEAVAEAAGCSRATLYRRFAGKADMVASAMYQTARGMERATPTQGSPRTLLLAHVHNMAEFFRAERGRALLGVNACAWREPDLAIAVEQAVRGDVEIHCDLLRRIHPGASTAAVDLAFDILRGTLLLRMTTMQDEALGSDQIEALVDAAIGVLHANI